MAITTEQIDQIVRNKKYQLMSPEDQEQVQDLVYQEVSQVPEFEKLDLEQKEKVRDSLSKRMWLPDLAAVKAPPAEQFRKLRGDSGPPRAENYEAPEDYVAAKQSYWKTGSGLITPESEAIWGVPAGAKIPTLAEFELERQKREKTLETSVVLDREHQRLPRPMGEDEDLSSYEEYLTVWRKYKDHPEEFPTSFIGPLEGTHYVWTQDLEDRVHESMERGVLDEFATAVLRFGGRTVKDVVAVVGMTGTLFGKKNFAAQRMREVALLRRVLESPELAPKIEFPSGESLRDTVGRLVGYTTEMGLRLGEYMVSLPVGATASAVEASGETYERIYEGGNKETKGALVASGTGLVSALLDLIPMQRLLRRVKGVAQADKAVLHRMGEGALIQMALGNSAAVTQTFAEQCALEVTLDDYELFSEENKKQLTDVLKNSTMVSLALGAAVELPRAPRERTVGKSVSDRLDLMLDEYASALEKGSPRVLDSLERTLEFVLDEKIPKSLSPEQARKFGSVVYEVQQALNTMKFWREGATGDRAWMRREPATARQESIPTTSNLLGVESIETPLPAKQKVWLTEQQEKLRLQERVNQIAAEELSISVDYLSGKIKTRPVWLSETSKESYVRREAIARREFAQELELKITQQEDYLKRSEKLVDSATERVEKVLARLRNIEARIKAGEVFDESNPLPLQDLLRKRESTKSSVTQATVEKQAAKSLVSVEVEQAREGSQNTASSSPDKLVFTSMDGLNRKSMRSNKDKSGVIVTTGQSNTTGKRVLRSVTFPKTMSPEARADWMNRYNLEIPKVSDPAAVPLGQTVDVSLMEPIERRAAQSLIDAADSARLLELGDENLNRPSTAWESAKMFVATQMRSNLETLEKYHPSAAKTVWSYAVNSVIGKRRISDVCRKIASGLSEAEQLEVGRVHEFGDKPSSPQVAKAAKQLRAVWRFFANSIFEAGGMTQGTDGTWSPTFESREQARVQADSYLPRMIKESELGVLDMYGPKWTKAVQELSQKRKITTEEAAGILLKDFKGRMVSGFGNLDHRRTVPEKLYFHEENPFVLLQRYNNEWWDWFFGHKYFGYKPGVRKQPRPGEVSKEQIVGEVRKAHGLNAAKMTQQALDDIFVKKQSWEKSVLEDWMRPVRAMTVVKTIGFNVTSVLKQLTQPFVGSIPAYGALSHMKAVARLTRLPELFGKTSIYPLLRKSAVTGIDPTTRLGLERIHDWSQKAAQISLVAFKPADNVGRLTGGLAGLDYAEAQLRVARGERFNLRLGTQEQRQKWAREGLEDLGIDPTEAIKRGKFTHQEKLVIMKTAADTNYFQSSAVDLPLGWATNPWAKTFLVLQKFNWLQAHLVLRDFLWKELKRGNPWPILRMGIAPVVGGETGIAMSNWLMDEDRTETSLVSRVLNDVAWVGSWGLVHDITQRDWKQLFNPAVVGTFAAVGRLAGSLVPGGTTPREALENAKPNQLRALKRVFQTEEARAFDNYWKKLKAAERRSKDQGALFEDPVYSSSSKLWRAAEEDSYSLFKSEMDRRIKSGSSLAKSINSTIETLSPSAMMSRLGRDAREVFKQSFGEGELKPESLEQQRTLATSHWKTTARKLKTFGRKYKEEQAEFIREHRGV